MYGSGWISAYEYVEDGAIADPWRSTRPWASVSIREGGLQTCLGDRSMRECKNAIEGMCADGLGFRGFILRDEPEEISLPSGKL